MSSIVLRSGLYRSTSHSLAGQARLVVRPLTGTQFRQVVGNPRVLSSWKRWVWKAREWHKLPTMEASGFCIAVTFVNRSECRRKGIRWPRTPQVSEMPPSAQQTMQVWTKGRGCSQVREGPTFCALGKYISLHLSAFLYVPKECYTSKIAYRKNLVVRLETGS